MSAIALTVVLGVAAKIAEGVSASRRRIAELEVSKNLRKSDMLFAALEAKGICVPAHGVRCSCFQRNYVRHRDGKCTSWWIKLEPSEHWQHAVMFDACCHGVEPLAVVRASRYRGRPGIGARTVYRYQHLAWLCPACGRAAWRHGPQSDPGEDFIQGGSVRAFAFGADDAGTSGPYR